MAENNRVQLNREEIVGNEVVLSEIAPKTNTESVDDSAKGTKLSQTLEKIWNDINNKLSREVNSVNGRTGVVVINAADVGLGNVDDVSFDDIKKWVIERLQQEFNNHTLQLFNNMNDAQLFASEHGPSYAGTPFYSSHGFMIDDPAERSDYRAHIGYFFADGNSLAINSVALDTIGMTDNSLIYNTSIEGKNFSGGMIGVNIWKYEDALKLYNAHSGDPATPATLGESGLYIDRDAISQNVFIINGCYGDGTPSDISALLYLEGQEPSDAIRATFTLNGQILNRSYVYIRKELGLKKNDIIFCNFDDIGYRDANGDLLSSINPAFVCKQLSIGKVIQTPTREYPTQIYQIHFFTLTPYVGHGIGYKTVSGSNMPDSNLIGVELTTGLSDGTSEYNVSGLNAFNKANVSDISEAPEKDHYVITPEGEKKASSKIDNNGLYVSTDFSMSVLPYGLYEVPADAPLTNLPLPIPSPSDVEDPSYVGVNPVKRVDSVNRKAYNMSGLRINTDIDTINNEWLGKDDSDTSDKLAMPIYSTGGLSVNVGKFLEIGEGIDSTTPKAALNYYDYGKVNVRTDGRSLGDVGHNELGVQASHYANYEQNDLNHSLGGGLVYTDGFNADVPGAQLRITKGLTINRGLGLRMSHYDRFGDVPPNESYVLLTEEPADFNPVSYFKSDGQGGYVRGEVGDVWASNTWYELVHNTYEDRGFLAVSVIDPQFCDRDFDPEDRNPSSRNSKQMTYGGLRYLVSPSNGTNSISAIGLRVNQETAEYGHELRLGSRAIGIDENNVVGVQLYRETDSLVNDCNPLNIKSWDEFALFKYVEMPWMKYTVIADTLSDLNTGIFSETPHSYAYSYVIPVTDPVTGDPTWPAAGTYYTQDGSSYIEITVGGRGTQAEPYVPEFELNKYYNRMDTSPDFVHRDDTIYYVKAESKRYVWNADTNAYEPMFIYFNNDVIGVDGGRPTTGNKNKVYVVTVVDNVDHKIWGKMYQWKEAYKVQLPMSWDPATQTYSETSPNVDSIIASQILHYYAIAATEHYQGYYINGNFYYGPTTVSGMLPKEEGKYYEDLMYPEPHMMYECVNNAYRTFYTPGGDDMQREDLYPCDLNNDGHIDAVDASIAMRFYAINSSTTMFEATFPAEMRNDPNTTTRDYLAYFLTEYYQVEENIDPCYITKRKTDDNGSFIPGLDIDINEHQGLTTVLNGDIKKAVSVKIFDESAGYTVSDKYGFLKRGGLRFTTEGFLSLRVNNLSSYNATTPEGRTASDIQAPNPDGRRVDETGSKGLMIYGDNVVGVQLSADGSMDNGELCLDEDGCLKISPNYSGGGGGGEFLTISDTDSHQVQYNGSSPINIELGAGLTLEITPD